MTSIHSISTEPVTINAPTQVVWDILTDFEKYPEWNPFSVKAESTLKVGKPVVLYIAQKNGKLMKQTFTLDVFEPPHKIVWRLPRIIHRRIFNACREQRVTPIDDQHCTYATCDIFAGWLAGSIHKANSAWVKEGFQNMITALKTRAEEMSG